MWEFHAENVSYPESGVGVQSFQKRINKPPLKHSVTPPNPAQQLAEMHNAPNNTPVFSVHISEVQHSFSTRSAIRSIQRKLQGKVLCSKLQPFNQCSWISGSALIFNVISNSRNSISSRARFWSLLFSGSRLAASCSNLRLSWSGDILYTSLSMSCETQ